MGPAVRRRPRRGAQAVRATARTGARRLAAAATEAEAGAVRGERRRGERRSVGRRPARRRRELLRGARATVPRRVGPGPGPPRDQPELPSALVVRRLGRRPRRRRRRRPPSPARTVSASRVAARRRDRRKRTGAFYAGSRPEEEPVPTRRRAFANLPTTSHTDAVTDTELVPLREALALAPARTLHIMALDADPRRRLCSPCAIVFPRRLSMIV